MVNPLELPTITQFGVTLRPWQLADAPALETACGDQAIMRFTTIPETYTNAAASEWIRRQRQRAQDGTAIVLAIVAADELSPVGMVGLFGLERADQTARLGYWVLDEARGRGLATTAARGLTAWGFACLGLTQVIIDREPNNLASARIAEGLGAEQIGPRLVEHRGYELNLIRYVIHQP